MKIFLVHALALLLAACSSSPPKTALRNIQVVAEAGANQDLPTALDIVFVYDTTSVSLLPQTGPEWFGKKASLMSGLAKSIDVLSLQVPPAEIVTLAPKTLPDRHKKAIGVYSFPNYLAPAGQARGNLTPFKNPTIRLTADNVLYSDN